MRVYAEPARSLPVVAETDLIVVGGGPGGLPAAVAAARHGADVLLVERYGFLGGLATAGLVAPILGHTASRVDTPGRVHRHSEPIVEGLLKEMVERMHALDGALSWEESCWHWGIYFDAEALKKVADDLAQEVGVNLQLHTLVTDAIIENGHIRGVIIESKSGRQAIMAKMVVDATGDADVAYRSEAETRKGRPFDGLAQSAGWFVHIGGVWNLGEEQVQMAVDKVRAATLRGDLHVYSPLIVKYNTFHRDFLSPNIMRIAGDATDAGDLSRMELRVRRNAWELIEFLRSEVSGFDKCYLQATPAQVGIRESRRAIGDYVLTGQDVIEARRFEDGVARGSWFVDIHCPYGHPMPVHCCAKECVQQDACPYWRAEHEGSMVSKSNWGPPQDDWYDIPYRCLVPKGIEGLLVSGRCISATPEGMASTRVMGTCMGIGQAAGTAAALALRHGVIPRDVDVQEVRSVLRSDGALV